MYACPLQVYNWFLRIVYVPFWHVLLMMQLRAMEVEDSEDRSWRQNESRNMEDVNPLTTDDECTHHATLAARYQMAQSVLKIGFALAKKAG